MPEITTGDAQPGGAAEGGEAAGAAGAGTKPGKTFTQEELDAILEARLKRAVPADYEDLKRLKAENDARAEADKTELQKAKEAEASATAKAAQATATANGRLKRAAILEAATEAGAVDAGMVATLLMPEQDITVTDDGEVKGAAPAVKALLKEKPFLAKGTAQAGPGGEFGGNDPKDKTAKIAELEAKAADPKLSAQERGRFYAEARALKLATQ